MKIKLFSTSEHMLRQTVYLLLFHTSICYSVKMIYNFVLKFSAVCDCTKKASNQNKTNNTFVIFFYILLLIYSKYTFFCVRLLMQRLLKLFEIIMHRQIQSIPYFRLYFFNIETLFIHLNSFVLISHFVSVKCCCFQIFSLFKFNTVCWEMIITVVLRFFSSILVMLSDKETRGKYV